MRTLKEIYNGIDENSFKARIKNDFAFFCERVLGSKLSNFHLEQIKLLNQGRYICIISPRGHLKTTLFAIAYPIWKLWNERNIEICLISSALDQSKKTLEKVQEMIENNEFLRELMPKDRQNSWNKFELNCSNGNKYFIKPFNSTIRGIHVDYCICDDILREENISQEQIKELFWSVIYPIVQTKKGQLIVVGVPMTENDLLDELSRKEGWLCKRWSAVKNKNGKWVEPLWPERFNLEELKSIRDAQGDFKFNREYLCDVKRISTQLKNIFVGRKAEIEKIEKAIEKGNHILIIGPSGIGKTSLLLHLKDRIENSIYLTDGVREIFLALCKKLDVSTKDKFELINVLRTLDQKIVLLLDDADEITNEASKEVNEFIEGLIVIATGREEPEYEKLAWQFKEKIKLKPLSLKETAELIKAKTGSNPDKNYIRKIYWLTKGMPLAIVDFLNELEKKLINGKSLDKAIEEIGPHPSIQAFKTDLFPIFGIIAIAYFLLALRYIARAGDNTALYLTSGTLGFVLLAMIRYAMYRKRSKK